MTVVSEDNNDDKKAIKKKNYLFIPLIIKQLC